jgi:cobalt-zinc-cadmium efflux system membrane fusion protein
MKKYIIPILITLSVLSCSKKEEEIKPQAKKGFELSNTMLKSIALTKVEKKNIEDDYSFYGKISADKNSYIDVYPLVGGNVLSVNVELGDHVRKGQVLATIRSTELADVQKEVSDAKTDLVVAQNNLRVAKEMYDNRTGCAGSQKPASESPGPDAAGRCGKHGVQCEEGEYLQCGGADQRIYCSEKH